MKRQQQQNKAILSLDVDDILAKVVCDFFHMEELPVIGGMSFLPIVN